MIQDKNHYVYRITNIKTKKHYYGVRTTVREPIRDIGVTYFSSSSDKDFIKEQKDFPENFKYKIVRILQSKPECIELEIKLHDKFNVSNNDNFYNKARQTKDGFTLSFKIEVKDTNNNLIGVFKKYELLKWAIENDIEEGEVLKTFKRDNEFLYQNTDIEKDLNSKFYGYTIYKL